MFHFKKFSVAQDQCAMKVGTDGVLLGAWVNARSPQHILDIGTGTGLIALMLAQRFDSAQLTAIDLDEAAAQQAKKNFEASPWVNRLELIALPLQQYNSSQAYDLIVSNPPYFENVSKAKGPSRTQARHTDSLSFEDLIKHAASLLSQNGKLALILPANVKDKVKDLAQKEGLFLCRSCAVQGNATSPVKRYLLEFSFQQLPLEEEQLIIEKGRHQYTEEYIRLCKDFYLKM